MMYGCRFSRTSSLREKMLAMLLQTGFTYGWSSASQLPPHIALPFAVQPIVFLYILVTCEATFDNMACAAQWSAMGVTWADVASHHSTQSC